MVDVRVKNLIALGIWDVDHARYAGWLSQFTSDEEQFFAACVLDNLIYRTKSQFSAALCALIRGPIRWELQSVIPGSSDLDLQRALSTGSIRDLVMIPAIDDSEPPTKSGPFVMRRLKKTLGLHDCAMDWPWNIPSRIKAGNVSTVLILDDFVGTGTQVVDYLKATFGTLDPSIRWLYGAVAAHNSGIEHIHKHLPNLEVFTAELLGKEHGLFDDKYWKTVSSGGISSTDAATFYLNFLSTRGLRTPKSHFQETPFGFGGLGLCFGFEHGTPDNSLPILWAVDNNWQPLLER